MAKPWHHVTHSSEVTVYLVVDYRAVDEHARAATENTATREGEGYGKDVNLSVDSNEVVFVCGVQASFFGRRPVLL